MNPKNNLVALGSAAVIAVYAAGFGRTRAAAQRFAGADAVRRPPPPSPSIGTEPIGAPAPRVAPTPPTSAVASKPAAAAAPKKERADSLPITPATTPAVQPPATKAIDSTPVAVAPPVAAPVVAAPRDSSSTTTTPKPDSATQADKERVGWKDGLYFGWGTSRHGDIQAGVEIKGGRIASAFISECLTRYSCSVIAALPPQVVTRQSAEVDYVSGATQSANAFYTAVLEALKKAK